MIRSSHCVFVLSCAIISSCQSEVPSEDLSSQSNSIQGGQADSGHPAVGIVWFQGGSFCTGTLIAPNVVLTAAHCVAYPIVSFYTGSGQPQTNVNSPPSNMVAHTVVEQIAYNGATWQGVCPVTPSDLALVRLADPITDITPMSYGTATPAIGTTCTAVGFGLNGSAYLEKRTGLETITSISTTGIGAQYTTAIADYGDSGGPLLCNDAIVGTASCKKDGNWPSHTTEYYGRVDITASWINSMIEAWNPNGGSGGAGGSSSSSTTSTTTDTTSSGEGGAGGSDECSVQVVVNEVSNNGSSASDEFVELYNSGTCSVSLEGWKLKYSSKNGSSPSTRWTGTSNDVLDPGEYFVLAGASFTANANGQLSSGLSSSGGAVGLYDATSTLVDAFAWANATSTNPLVEGQPASSIASGFSASRIPDGNDTNNNANDFSNNQARTPGASND